MVRRRRASRWLDVLDRSSATLPTHASRSRPSRCSSLGGRELCPGGARIITGMGLVGRLVVGIPLRHAVEALRVHGLLGGRGSGS